MQMRGSGNQGLIMATPNNLTDTQPTPQETSPGKELGRRVAVVSFVFCLVLSAFLVANHLAGKAADPIQSPKLTALKAELVKQPKNDALKKEIRALDLDLRRKLDRHLALETTGAWMLAGGLVVFLVSIKTAVFRKKLPRPAKKVSSLSAESRAMIQSSLAAAGVGVMVLGAGWFWTAHSPTLLVAQQTKTNELAAVVASMPTTPFPDAAELKGQWPRFRGPDGSGISAFSNAPVQWNGTNGEGVVWKVKTPISGPNSPVIWGDKLFCTGATSQKREVYCYDALTGKLLWQKAVTSAPGAPTEPPTVMEDTGGYAASTVATDGRRVYAIFANADVAAFDYQGNPVWNLNLGKFDNSYGYATSLILYQNRLLIQNDQGAAKDGKSKLIALDTATGKTVWETQPRPVPNSWATPVLINAAQKDQVITCGNPWVIAYDASNGTELWRVQALYGEVTPSPIFNDGLVYTAMDGENLTAIKPDGTGDVTKTHIAWKADEGLPDIVSPFCDGKRVYVTSSGGTVTCYNAKDGKKLWNKEFEVTYKSSPAMSGDRIYMFNDKGECVIIQAADEYKEIARADLGEEVLSSPAFADGRLYIRGKTNLFCLGTKLTAAAK
jgi:outer membrane protein assembly factor BamB